MPTVVRTACPFDCPCCCGILAHVDDGRLVRVTGDPDHPWSRGRLCPKMLNYERTVHSPRRLLTPLVRRGPKGEGSFAPVSWDDALPLVAERIAESARSVGPESILPYSYAGTMGLLQRNALHPLFHFLGASRLERTICTPAKEHAWRSLMGDTPALDPEEVAESDLIVLWGIDALATDIQFFHRVAAARRRGVPVIGIDVYRTPTLKRCDGVVILSPGTDGLFALGVMHLLADRGWIDRSFVAERVAGFDDLVREILPRHPPERVAPRCGVTVETLEEFARRYAAARAPLIRLGGGLSRAGNGAATLRAILTLPALVGAYGRRGGGCFPGTSTGRWFSLERLTREDLLGGRSPRTINMNRLGEALTSATDPPVSLLYVSHSNPAAVAPDSGSVRRGLSREDLFTVVHERFMTDTARFADVVLPATSSVEHPDIYRAYGSYSLQRVDAAIPPVGGARSNWGVVRSLARLLGCDDPLFGLDDDGVLDLLVAAHPPDCRFDPVLLNRRIPTTFRLDPDEARRFSTPDGRIRIRDESEPHPLPDWFPPHCEGERERFPLFFTTAPSLFSLNSSFMERDDLRVRLGGEPTLLINPSDALSRGIADGCRVAAESPVGRSTFRARVTTDVPEGGVVSPGVWWSESSPDGSCVNMLTHQRLTDGGRGSTFSDLRVEVFPLR